MTDTPSDQAGPLHGLRVVEIATLAAGPTVATTLGEFGAEVIKVEAPGSGDPMRTWGDRRDGIGLLWKSIGRNKRFTTLDLRTPRGRSILHRLLALSDVLVAGNRPSTLESWGLDYDSVHAAHPHLVMAHITGYGQGGPKEDQAGYGTLAEAMSGFAHQTGEADGPPTLPPFMLADGVAGLTATYAVMMALYHRDVHGAGGQLVDVSLVEPLSRLLESGTLAYGQLGAIKRRSGNMLPASAPRNTYATADGQWLAVSSASPSIAARVFRAVGREDMARDPAYIDPVSRQERAAEVDQAVADWVGKRTLEEATVAFELAGAAAAPVYDAPALLADEHLRARGTFRPVGDPDLGEVTVQSPVPRLSGTPGRVTHLARGLGADNESVYRELLGLSAEALDDLRAEGTI
jgi:crotonobetainyl-CoA:carnitine CoA-transferase CaiB-like acyl-CoA transferase